MNCIEQSDRSEQIFRYLAMRKIEKRNFTKGRIYKINLNKGKRLKLPNRPPEPNSVNVTYGRCSTNLGPPCSVISRVSVDSFMLWKTLKMLFLASDMSSCKKWGKFDHQVYVKSLLVRSLEHQSIVHDE